jgi:hypothetical protein
MINFKNIPIILWVITIIILLIYAVLKEREELGCYRFSIARQCNDDESVYIKNTKMNKNDTKDILYDRMISILSYHEKAGIWKRCLIIGTILFLITFIMIDSKCNKREWIALHLSFIMIIYFFFNYINYHHFRRLKQNGVEILEELKNRE